MLPVDAGVMTIILSLCKSELNRFAGYVCTVHTHVSWMLTRNVGKIIRFSYFIPKEMFVC